MASKVQIANEALVKIGAATITALTDNTESAIKSNLLFDSIADEVMTIGAWSSTITRAALAKLATNPAWGFDSQFQLPTDPFCLRVLEINQSIVNPNRSPRTTGEELGYAIEGDRLLIDADSVSIRYIGRITDTEAYDPMLKRAIVHRLAAELAYTITGNASLAERLMQLYQGMVAEGLAVDGQQGSNEITVTNELTLPRIL
jgi:hypothetical protein